METIIVGGIIIAAAGYAVYRLFFKPSCGCGQDCGCANSCNCQAPTKGACESKSGNGGCNCGK